MRKLKYIFIVAVGAVLMGCNDFLDTKSESIITDDVIFADEDMIKGVLAGLHRATENFDRSSHRMTTSGGFEAAVEGTETRDENNDISRPLGRNVFENNSDNNFITYQDTYLRIRRVNKFLASLKETTVLTEDEKKPYEGEARFLRAYFYWNLARFYGGMVLVGDNVWIFTPGISQDEITETMALPRSTHKATLDYIMSELDYASSVAPAKTSSNWDHFNTFIPIALKARVALHAASIAHYTPQAIARGNGITSADVTLATGNAGIPASEAAAYFQTALTAAETVIKNGGYSLVQEEDVDAPTQDLADNFLNAVMNKNNNTEVIWALDHSFPSYANGTNFLENVAPFSHSHNAAGSRMQSYLNTAEFFLFRDGSGPAVVKAANIHKTNAAGGSRVVYDYRKDAPVADRKPIVYQNLMDVWQKNLTLDVNNVATTSGNTDDDRDPRMYASIVVPGSDLNVVYKQGEVFMMTGLYRADLASDLGTDIETLWDGLIRPNRVDAKTKTINGMTVEYYSDNGPFPRANENNLLRTGLIPRKWISTTEDPSNNPSTWQLRIRLAEMYLIAAEAMGEGGATSTLGETALSYLNKTRERAGVADAAAYSFSALQLERNAEFTFEDQRIHDQMRWRIRHEVFPSDASTLPDWTQNVQYARPLSLYPFRYFDATDKPNYDTSDRTKYKWVFARAPFYLMQGTYYFNPSYYYYSFSDGTFNDNQKFTGNPNNRPDGR